MKGRFIVLTSLACICWGMAAGASECTGTECDFISYMEAPGLKEAEPAPVVTTPAPRNTSALVTKGTTDTYIYAGAVPMRNIKTLTIKPVPADTRPALYDGTHGNYKARAADKTVDWRDGVPLWDDSIVDYRRKDFSDWFLEPTPEVYLRQIDNPSESVLAMYGTPPVMVSDESVSITELYNQNMSDAAATRARVEELLTPNMPVGDIWSGDGCKDNVTSVTISGNTNMPRPRAEYTAQDMTEIVAIAFNSNDAGCPFESETECAIWRRKPMIRETISPRSKKLRAPVMDNFISHAQCNGNIDATDPAAAPLLDRYKMLMRSAAACCSDGMVYSLKQAGASDGLVYKFMADDANFYGLGARCLMMTDEELDRKYPNTATAVVAADVRNGCLCRGRQWFSAMLAPFKEAWRAAPEFAQSQFNYTYTDGLKREITVSINNDVRNVLNQLEQCP
ncbi:hypothetical protein HDR66_00545 [bacterium]|nr:hypothetical protein [bacterium]